MSISILDERSTSGRCDMAFLYVSNVTSDTLLMFSRSEWRSLPVLCAENPNTGEKYSIMDKVVLYKKYIIYPCNTSKTFWGVRDETV